MAKIMINVEPNLFLRLLDEDDAQQIYELILKNQAHLGKFFEWAEFVSLEKQQNFIFQSWKNYAERTGLDLAIQLGNEIIGMLSLKITKKNKTGEIGYWLDQDFTGQGIVIKAVMKLISLAFDQYQLHRILIKAETTNHRSRNIPERLGFHHDGSLRHEVFRNHTYQDQEVYSLLSSEWLNGS